MNDPEYAVRGITPLLVHDVNIWDSCVNRKTVIRYWKMRREAGFDKISGFIGYWEKGCPVKSETEKVYCSVYQWNEKSPWLRAIAVGNFNRTAKPVRLRIDWKKLGVSKPETVRELWTGKNIPVSELENYELRGNHFALFGIKP